MYLKAVVRYALVPVFLLGACTNVNQTNNDNEVAEEKIDATHVIMFDPDAFKDEDIVFYNLFSPVDLNYLVTKDVSFYNSTLLNPLNNIVNYNESIKASLNLGIYGADLSYLWLFNQSQQAHSYLTAIQQLSDQLGIPREFVDFTYAKAQDKSEDVDTLIDMARKSYYTAEKYLNESDRSYAASLVLLGGWIETLYIATHMQDVPDAKIISKIAAQKFSSRSMLKLLQNSQQTTDLSEYILLVKKLNRLFEKLDIQYPEGSLVIDTTKRRILVSEDVNIQISELGLQELRELTEQIRNYIVE